MYNSLKGQQRMRGHTRRSVSVKPIPNKIPNSGAFPETEEAELGLIQAAIRDGRPLYMVQHANGGTFEMTPDLAHAIRVREGIDRRTSANDTIRRVHLYKRTNTALTKVV